MISQDLLDMLRCPLDPSHVRLEIAGESLICTRCRLRFPVRHGIPSMLVEEAELPPSCASLDDLPCQRDKAATAATPGGKP
jgi:uncharacterized protein YbaR (Trm112 family)